MKEKHLRQIYSKKQLGVSFQNDWQMYADCLKVKKNPGAIKVMIYVGVLNCAYYRVFIPMMELAKNPDFDIRVGNFLSQQDDVDWADIIIFERFVNRNVINEAKRARLDGKKVVFETDDYLHGLPQYHPCKRGQDNSRQLQDMDAICQLSNLITVSTEYLRKLYAQKYFNPVVVLPNCVDLETWDKAKSLKFNGEKVVIGWGGSPSHFEDLKLVAPVLTDLFEDFPELVLMTMFYSGREDGRDALDGVPLERRIHIGEVDPHMVCNYFGLIDIGIAPLVKNEFNHSKSNVKVLEYSLAGVPTVASKLEAYKDDREVVFLKSNLDGWYDTIAKLARDKDKRVKAGEKAREWVRSRYDIKQNVHLWEKALKGLMK